MTIPNILPASISGYCIDRKKIDEPGIALRFMRLNKQMTQTEFLRNFGHCMTIPGWPAPKTPVAISQRERGKFIDHHQIDRLSRAIFGLSMASVFPALEKKWKAEAKEAEKKRKAQEKEAAKKEKIMREMQRAALSLLREKFGFSGSISLHVG